MGKEIGHTGGLRTIDINSEDRKRWESEDTDSTKAFKEAFREWKNKPKSTSSGRPAYRFLSEETAPDVKLWKKIVLVLIFILGIAVLYYLVKAKLQ